MLTTEFVRKPWISALVADYPPAGSKQLVRKISAIGLWDDWWWSSMVFANRYAHPNPNGSQQNKHTRPAKFLYHLRRLVYRCFGRHTKIRSGRWRSGNGEGQ
jgi:hypothetical protein